MPFYQTNGVRYYSFPTFEELGVVHAAVARQGGVSPAPWASLNLGGTVGDDSRRVVENRQRAFSALQLDLESLYDVWQVHGDRVVVTQKPRPASQEILQADAILTDRPGVTLFMRFADCVPIFFFDPAKGVIGLAHAGWMGTVKRIAGLTVRTMAQRFGSRPEEIIAGIGPSIAAHHYPVGPEVVAQVRESFGKEAAKLLTPVDQDQPAAGMQFDLWLTNQLILEQEGVRNIDICGLCTACHTDDWFSHRAEHGRTGRFGALISLVK